MSASENAGVKEVIPRSGLLFQESALHPVLCKPKLMPLKSVTLEKLERMQKEAQDKMWQMHMEEGEESDKVEETTNAEDEGITKRVSADVGQADVWRADDDN